MANSDIPNGFLPYNSPHGGSGQPTMTEHLLLAANAAIGVGDTVSVQAGGVDKLTSGGACLGIAAESKSASSSDSTIKVWSDPQQLFVGQTDNGTGTATAAAAVGLNIDLVNGAPSNGRSIQELDESSATTTATLMFKIIELSKERVGNTINAHGEFNRLVVKINNHQLQGHTGTAGV